MSITNDCMTVNLQIGVWQGYRLDKDASRRITSEAQADHDAARVNKHIVPKDALAPINTAAGKVRLHFYSKTLPWKDNGDRLLTRKLYQAFIDEHHELRGEFQSAVEHFVEQVYPVVREQANFRMGELFNRGDYPAQSDLYRRFYIGLDIDAVTTANDFRVAVDDVQQVKDEMERKLQDRITTAMGDVWSRLSTTLGHFADRMEGDVKWRDTTVTNLQELVDMLPGLNILNDPQLEAICLEIEQKIARWEPKDLRKKPEIQAELGAEARAIMDSMAGFMQAFSRAE